MPKMINNCHISQLVHVTILTTICVYILHKNSVQSNVTTSTGIQALNIIGISPQRICLSHHTSMSTALCERIHD